MAKMKVVKGHKSQKWNGKLRHLVDEIELTDSRAGSESSIFLRYDKKSDTVSITLGSTVHRRTKGGVVVSGSIHLILSQERFSEIANRFSGFAGRTGWERLGR